MSTTLSDAIERLRGAVHSDEHRAKLFAGWMRDICENRKLLAAERKDLDGMLRWHDPDKITAPDLAELRLLFTRSLYSEVVPGDVVTACRVAKRGPVTDSLMIGSMRAKTLKNNGEINKVHILTCDLETLLASLPSAGA